MDTRRPVVPEAEEIIDAYFPALDYGFVTLKDYMGTDASVEESARVSYGAGTRKISDTRSLLRFLFRHRHTSPFEMVEMRFHLGLPIFVMRQLVRHRTAGLNEYSGRYSVMPMLFYTPEREQVCHQSKKNKQGRGATVGEETYGKFWRESQTQRGMAACNYSAWITEEDIARETARMDLPLSTYTYCYWKIDLRNMFNVLSLRGDPHAQWEIQQYADLMAGVVKRLCPLSFEAFQDYQQTSVSFTQLEMRALRVFASCHVSPIAWGNPPASAYLSVNEFLASEGCAKREVAEFWDKLKVRAKRDFSLNLDDARDGSYYQEMAEKHSLESPQLT